MPKKNNLQSIADKNSRDICKDYAGWHELNALNRGFTSLISPKPYQMSLHVVGIASCIEAFSKSCLKTLIDVENSPYLDRAENFKDLSFDFELTKALSRKEITFGDLVSHNVSVSSADQIIRHFDTLFKGDTAYKNFKHCLSSVREFIEPPEEVVMNGSENQDIEYGDFIVSDADELINNIQSIFTSRHIIAHEANFQLITSEQVLEWFRNASLFVEATYEIIEQRLRPGVPRAAFGSSIHALQNSGLLYSKIDDLWQDLVDKWKAEKNLDEAAKVKLWAAIKDSEDAFSNYLEKEITLHFLRVGVISGHGYRHLEAMIQKMLLETKFAYLKRLNNEA